MLSLSDEIVMKLSCDMCRYEVTASLQELQVPNKLHNLAPKW